MDAFEKAFTTVQVKASMNLKVGDNHTRSGTLVKAPAAFSVEAYVAVASSGIKLTEKLSSEDKARSISRTTKDAVTGAAGTSAAAYLTGFVSPEKPDPVPEKVKNRGRAVVPSENATATADGAASK